MLINPSLIISGKMFRQSLQAAKNINHLFCLHINEINAAKERNNSPVAIHFTSSETKPEKIICCKNKFGEKTYIFILKMEMLQKKRNQANKTTILD
jgi:hypothetical protein